MQRWDVKVNPDHVLSETLRPNDIIISRLNPLGRGSWDTGTGETFWAKLCALEHIDNTNFYVHTYIHTVGSPTHCFIPASHLRPVSMGNIAMQCAKLASDESSHLHN